MVAATIFAIIIVWSAFSGPLDRRGITSALFLTAAGFLAGGAVLGLLEFDVESEVAQRVAEVALVLLLPTPPGSTCARSVTSSAGSAGSCSSGCH